MTVHSSGYLASWNSHPSQPWVSNTIILSHIYQGLWCEYKVEYIEQIIYNLPETQMYIYIYIYHSLAIQQQTFWAEIQTTSKSSILQ